MPFGTVIASAAAGIVTVGYGLIQCTACFNSNDNDYSTFVVNPEAFDAARADAQAKSQESELDSEQADNNGDDSCDANSEPSSAHIGSAPPLRPSFSATLALHPEIFKVSRSRTTSGSAASQPRARTARQPPSTSDTSQAQDLSDRLVHTVTRSVSELILKAAPVGCYLIRVRVPSDANEKAYALSIRLLDGSVCHIQLNQSVSQSDFTVTSSNSVVTNCKTLHRAVHALAAGGSCQSLLGKGSGCMRMVIYNTRQAGRLPPPPSTA